MLDVRSTASNLFWEVWKKKNRLTLHSLPVILLSIAILLLILEEGFIVDLISSLGSNRPFVIGTIFVDVAWFGARYSSIVKISIFDDAVRSIIYYTIFSIVLSCVAVVVFPSLAGPFLKQGKGLSLILLLFVIEMIGKQIMNLILLVFDPLFLSAAPPPNSASQSEEGVQGHAPLWTCKSITIYAIVHLVISIAILLFLWAMILPVYLSSLDLSEWERVVIFGILFPLFRFFVSFTISSTISVLDKIGSFFHNEEHKFFLEFTCNLAIALYFMAAPLFCMFTSSTDGAYFVLQFAPHAFISKFSWIRLVPMVQDYILFFYNLICCSCKKQAVIPQNSPLNKAKKESESKVIKVVRRASSILAQNNILLLAREEELNGENHSTVPMKELVLKGHDNNVIDEEKQRRNVGNNVMTVEQANIIGDTVAAFAALFKVLGFRFYSPNESSNEFDLNELINLVMCIGVVFIFDQITAVIFFSMLESQGIILNTDLGMGNKNPMNPLEQFRTGNKYKAFSDTIFATHFCVIVFLAIAFAEEVRLLF